MNFVVVQLHLIAKPSYFSSVSECCSSRYVSCCWSVYTEHYWQLWKGFKNHNGNSYFEALLQYLV